MRTRCLLIVAALLLARPPANAQIDTLDVDTSGDVPVVTLRDRTLASGVSSVTAGQDTVVIRNGPEPVTGAPSEAERSPISFRGLGWIVVIVVTILGAAATAYEQRRRLRRRRDQWEADAGER